MKTGYRMKTTSRRDYLQRIYQRYRDARNREKGRILDEFCANCGYHRKYAIRLLNGAPPESKPVRRPRRGRRVSYGAQVISILEAVWEAADYPWSLRLKAAIAAVDAVDSAAFSADGENRRTTASDQPA